jgi:hypothetical protein
MARMARVAAPGIPRQATQPRNQVSFLNRNWGGHFTDLFDMGIEFRLTSPPDGHERLEERA